jgi:hypothetical protein
VPRTCTPACSRQCPLALAAPELEPGGCAQGALGPAPVPGGARVRQLRLPRQRAPPHRPLRAGAARRGRAGRLHGRERGWREPRCARRHSGAARAVRGGRGGAGRGRRGAQAPPRRSPGVHACCEHAVLSASGDPTVLFHCALGTASISGRRQRRAVVLLARAVSTQAETAGADARCAHAVGHPHSLGACQTCSAGPRATRGAERAGRRGRRRRAAARHLPGLAGRAGGRAGGRRHGAAARAAGARATARDAALRAVGARPRGLPSGRAAWRGVDVRAGISLT